MPCPPCYSATHRAARRVKRRADAEGTAPAGGDQELDLDMDSGTNEEIDEVLAGLGASGSGAGACGAGQHGGGGALGHSAGGAGASGAGSPAQGQQIIQYQPPSAVLGARASNSGAGVAGGAGTAAGAGVSGAGLDGTPPGAGAAPDVLADYFLHQFNSMLTPSQPGAAGAAGPGPASGVAKAMDGLDAFSSAFDKMQLHPAAMAPPVSPAVCKGCGCTCRQS